MIEALVLSVIFETSLQFTDRCRSNRTGQWIWEDGQDCEQLQIDNPDATVLLVSVHYLTAKLVDRTITLTWDAPLLDGDGGELTDLVGYRVYRRLNNSEWTYGMEVLDTTLVVEDNSPGLWEFYVTAFDYSNNESEPSNTVWKVVE